MNQNNVALQPIKVIYQHLDFKNDCILDEENTTLYLNSQKNHRSYAFLQFPQHWLLFLDHDCQLSKELLQLIQRQLPELDSSTVYAGFYKNPENASLLQRTHNYICNAWLKKHSENLNSKRFLGGFFLVHSNKRLIELAHEQYSQDLFWGAEDDFLACALREKYLYTIQLRDEWFATHHTSSSLRHFLRRAFWQGWNKDKYLKANNKKTTKDSFVDCSNLLKQEKGIVVLALVHFAILSLAEKLHTIVRMSRRVKLKEK